MQVRLKRRGAWGAQRINSLAKIDNVIIKENLMAPEKENVAIFFRGRDSSGIINFSREEANSFIDSVRNRLELVKRMDVKEMNEKLKKRKWRKRTTIRT